MAVEQEYVLHSSDGIKGCQSTRPPISHTILSRVVLAVRASKFCVVIFLHGGRKQRSSPLRTSFIVIIILIILRVSTTFSLIFRRRSLTWSLSLGRWNCCISTRPIVSFIGRRGCLTVVIIVGGIISNQTEHEILSSSSTCSSHALAAFRCSLTWSWSSNNSLHRWQGKIRWCLYRWDL